MLDKYQLQEQWAIVDRIADIPNERRKAADWTAMRAALSALGYAANGPSRNQALRYERHWLVTIQRAGEGCMTQGRGATIEKAWRVAVAYGYGTIWRCEDSEHGVVTPWIIWQGLYQEAQQQIRAIRATRWKRAWARHHGCSVEIERVS